tara:strand:- start:190 stop:636 length:447 start_codon:yes stop_codon:yes gene_type:complete
MALQGGAGVGKVLQVVQGSTAVSSSTSSTAYQQSNLTASITPTSATSKILVLFTTTIVQTTQGRTAAATIYRDGTTNLGGGSESGLSMFDNQYPGGYVWVPSAGNVLDTPSTTSTTSYTLYFKVITGGTAVVNWAVNKATITLMEIAA